MMRTIPEQIAANKRASVFYAALLVLLLTALGAAITGFYDYRQWPIGAAGAALLGVILALVATFSGPSILLGISGAREATKEEDQVLSNVAEEMAIAAGIPKPKVYVIDDTAPNAFATGRDPQHGVVVFTRGILQKLNRDELQAVMAHEVSHIRNYDIRFMTTIALVAGVIPLLADALRHMAWYGGGRSRSSSRNDSGQAIFMLLALVLAVLAPIFSLLLQLAVSRKRELLADASAVDLTRNPDALATALERIAHDPEPLEAANRATQHMYIVNPMKAWDDDFSSIFSTHPPLSERLRQLRQLGARYSRPERRAPGDFSDMPEIPNQQR
ncbi:MAG: M48 family metallopeptidase [Fimbriimonadales bacterium]|nr:M48 family metallopeptidase [Fimbriimonadales bacterium]